MIKLFNVSIDFDKKAVATSFSNSLVDTVGEEDLKKCFNRFDRFIINRICKKIIFKTYNKCMKDKELWR